MPSIFVFYQYFHPDPNISSTHLTELCTGLAERGWNVSAYPGNRRLDDPSIDYPHQDEWAGVKIRRIWRPKLGRHSSLGRLVTAIWMILQWSLLAFRTKDSPDAIVIGTDPILSVLVAPVWRWLHPRTTIAHWCFDLYPEAAYADGVLSRKSPVAALLKKAVSFGYASCDLVADIGPCMKSLLAQYGNRFMAITLVPWALSEPAMPLAPSTTERRQIFGEAKLALMYSGTFGRAHSSEDLLALMDILRDDPIHLALSITGQREKILREEAASKQNVSFVAFAPKEKLDERLSSADIHVVSLRDQWTGTVVPSKFFGALAAGRPILFCGSPTSAIACWITQYQVGWVLEPGKATETAVVIREFLADTKSVEVTRDRCHAVYQANFSRQAVVNQWNSALKALVMERHLGAHAKRAAAVYEGAIKQRLPEQVELLSMIKNKISNEPAFSADSEHAAKSI